MYKVKDLVAGLYEYDTLFVIKDKDKYQIPIKKDLYILDDILNKDVEIKNIYTPIINKLTIKNFNK